MIRVAAILAAIALAPVLGHSTVAQAQAPKRVSDSYYAKRAQAKLEAAANLEAVAGGVAALDADGAALGAQPLSSASISRQGVDPYYAARQAAAAQVTPVNMFEPAPPQPNQFSEGEEGEEISLGSTDVVEPIPQGNVNGVYNAQPGSGLVDTYNEFVDCGVLPEPKSILWDEIHSCRTYWVNTEYLAWGLKGNHVPALVTTSPNGTPQAQAGVLGQPGTKTIFGDDRILTGIRSGGRITAGAWIVGDVVGIEANYFTLGTQNTDLSASGAFSGTGTGPILARPFVAPPDVASRLMLAYPNFILTNGAPANLDGTVHIHAASNLQSAGVDLKRMIAIDFPQDKRMFLIGGYRYLQLNESLSINDQITTNLTQIPITGVTTNFDQFSTFNQFQGGDVGLVSDIRRGRWVLESQAKVALGNMRETVEVNGNTSITAGGVSHVFPGGLLAQQSNMGHFTRNQFAAIPEFNFKLGLQLSCNWRATIGYNFMWISRVARPGNQIDTLVSIPNTPGGTQPVATPVYLNNPTSIWMQGITTGLEYRF